MEKRAAVFDSKFFMSAMDLVNTNLYITDAQTDRIVFMNDTMKKTFGIEAPEGKLCWEVLQKGMEGRCSFCRIECLRNMSGEKRCIWDEINTRTGRVFKNFDCLLQWNGREYYIQNSIDVTEYSQLSQKASMDELTCMMNRRAGKAMIKTVVERARCEHKPLVAALYDINELKSTNDCYGHSQGDRLIQYVASAVKENLGFQDFIFRLSGDEFVVVFYGETLANADRRMREILAQVEAGREKAFCFFETSFCYGLTEVYPGDRYSVSEIIARADEQMYIQKRSYHIRRARARLEEYGKQLGEGVELDYDKDHLYEALVASTDDYVFIGNMKTGVFRYPQEMVDEFGLPGLVVDNAAAFWGQIIHPDDEKSFLESNQEIADGRAEYHNIEYRARNAAGNWIWLRCRGKMIRGSDGEPGLFAGMITNLGKKNQIDHMTGLYNRYEFEGTIKKYMMDEKSGGMGIMILDMDAFKNVNDLYDRSFGDEVLRMTGQKIASLLPQNARIYRLDGDEFGILMANGDEAGVQSIFARIQHQFDRQQEYNGRKYFCTISAGCAFYPQDADNYLDLLKYANYSLEHSKRMGKNKATVFSSDLLKEKKRPLEIAELLRESIDRGFAGFSIHYQPVVNTLTGELYGAEALARWSCAKYGNVSPAEFIPILEQSGLIIPLGAWIFYHAAAQCSRWQKIRPDFHVSINLSYLQLQEGDVGAYIRSTLEELAVPPENVTLELTETYLMKEDEAVRGRLEEMQQFGLRIAMDDFGTGYSSLYSLKNVPVAVVKVDQGFVKGITSDRFNAAFIRSIAQLCHNVGKTVCLEGVETQEEYDAVKDMGIELIQGYYFSRPVPANVFEERFILKKED